MSDEPRGLEYAPDLEAGQPQEIHSDDATAAETQSRYVTLEDLDSFSEKLLRKFESLTAKSENRIKKELEANNRQVIERAEALRSAGYAITDADIKQAQDQFAKQLLTSGPAEPPAQELLQPAVDPATVKRVNLEMARLQAQYEIVPDETDAEFRGMNWVDPDPDRFLSDYKRRFEKLAKRLGKVPSEQPQEPPEPGVRLPVQGGSAANQQGLMEQYKTEVTKAGSVNERLNIRQKYRERGLEI